MTTCVELLHINDGQRRCRAAPPDLKAACGELFCHNLCRVDTSVPSQPPVKWGSRKEGGCERSSRG